MEQHIDSHAAALGEVLQRRRTDLEMSQTDLEYESGIPKPRISRYERGHIEPRIGTLVQLAIGLETTASKIMEEAGL